MICRIVYYCSFDAGMNEAFEEAMLLARLNGQSLDTVRVWQNRRAVVLGSNLDFNASVDEEICKKNEVTIVRKAAMGNAMYQDHGTLNLTYVLDQREIFPHAENLTSIYKQFCEPVAEALSRFRLDVKVDEYGQSILINGGKVSEAWVSFYHNLLLFQLSINVNTDLRMLAQMIRRKDVITTLSKELNKIPRLEEVESALIESITRKLGLKFERSSLSPAEERLAKRLYEIKYSKDDWNLKMKAPLTLKDVLVDVYVAYPPTMSCREIVENVNSAITNFRDRVELRVWMRGKGLNGKGCPPGVVMPRGLIKASKESIIPAVIINGQISFSRDVPSKEDLEDKILKVLK